MKSLVLLASLLFVAALNLANSQATQQAISPNLYELSGGQMHITYSTTGIDGQPHFSYENGSQKMSFKGKEIRTVQEDCGTLVSVTTRMTVDSGSTTFTLLVPTIRLKEFSLSQIQTYGITAIHKFSVIPAMNIGQTESYATTELSGTAKMVMF